MGFSLENVVPWGRNLEEYVSMFSLSENDLEKRLLGCADGPASFNTELTKRGGNVISVDPIYNFSALEIKKRIEATYELVMEQTRKNADEFCWDHVKSIEELGLIRISTMDQFLEDYEFGHERFVSAELPTMPFSDNKFDLVLCSHFLFLYSEHLTGEFQLRSIKELCRVAAETRVFPLLELGGRKSRHIDEVIGTLVEDGYEYKIEKVSYEFQKGGNEMLRVKSSKTNATGFGKAASLT